mgnify:CR=1 FL=1
MNLLSNAIKYTSEGSVTLTVNKLQSSEEISEIYVSVKDTGMGIKKEDISKLFNAFERFEEVKNHSIQGSGLGLNIVAYFLRMMNSNLDVKSEYGKGSEFFFQIPQRIGTCEDNQEKEEKVIKKDYNFYRFYSPPQDTRNRKQGTGTPPPTSESGAYYYIRESRHSMSSGVSSSSRSIHSPKRMSRSLRRSIAFTILNVGRLRSSSSRRDGRIVRSKTSFSSGRNAGTHLKLSNLRGCDSGT